jgi:iron-sulfur cluster assembly accessory protein
MVTEAKSHGDATEAASAGDAPVVLTSRAVEMLKEILAREGRAGQGLRVTVRDGGCSGLSYGVDFALAPAEGDVVVRQDGAWVAIDAAALAHLHGTTIDYVTGLHHAGFRFSNPRATRTCGCGESFSV